MGRLAIDEDALRRACTKDPALVEPLGEAARRIADTANAMSSGFRTERTKNYETGEHVGGTRPSYGYSTRVGKKGPVAIVMTKNYAAMKDTTLNNTLLKAGG